MEFSKIGISSQGVIQISYVSRSSFVDQNTRKMNEPPLASFPRALQDLASDVAELCELSTIHLRDQITVLSVNFKYHDDFGEGISMACEWALTSGKSYTFASPVYWSNGKNSLSASTLGRIDELRVEASKYLRGDRLQGRLDLPQDRPAKGKEPQKVSIEPKATGAVNYPPTGE